MCGVGECIRTVLSHFSPPPLSDNHICGRGDHSPHHHLPADQNPYSHRPHPGVQQVSPDVTVKYSLQGSLLVTPNINLNVLNDKKMFVILKGIYLKVY